MEAPWQEVKSGDEILSALTLGGVGEVALERILLAPDAERYLRVEAEGPSEGGGFEYRIPRTRYFFNVTACKDMRGDIAIALTAYLTTHSAPVSAGLAAMRKLAQSLKRLSDDEVAVVRAIIDAAAGNPYEEAVQEQAVRESYAGEPALLEDLLDSLQSKGVISARRGGRIKLVF